MSSKEKVLELLENNKSEYLSGEAIAGELGLSRNAIWKAINELRKQGYDIQAVRKKGYRLGEDNDIISAQGILSYLNDADLQERIHVYDAVASTNTIAKEMAISGTEHGTLVVACRQDGGRGHSRGSFSSPEGGIYMSVILLPEEMRSTEPAEITSRTGEIVRDAIQSLCDVSVRIEPINNLYLGDKRICGMLTESGTEFDSGRLQWVVIGIGIYFDVRFSDEPDQAEGALFPPGEATITKNQLIAEIYRGLIQ